MTKVKYEAVDRKGYTRHLWSIVEDHGGTHVWADFIVGRWIGGVEYHSRTESDCCTHNRVCWLLGGECWHTGSSLDFDDAVKPYLPEDGTVSPDAIEWVKGFVARRHAEFFTENEGAQ